MASHFSKILKVLFFTTCLVLLGCNRKSIDNDILKESFNTIKDKSRGTKVTFYMWAGSEKINRWIDGVVKSDLKKIYDIELERVPMDASIFVNKLLTEKSAKKEVGEIDLVWINGENFKNAYEGGVLFGPFTKKLPNFKKYISEDVVLTDAGFPVKGFESPYGKAQFNYIFDSDKVIIPPYSFDSLLTWVKRNPGRFTYPAPPDFTGSAFIRQAFYSLTGGYEQYIDGFDEDLFNRKSYMLWEYLLELEPYLWNKGKNYPKEISDLDKLFENGEVDFTMSFTQTYAQSKIQDGVFPESSRSLIFKDGSLFNTHFVAIPFNSLNKRAAMVLANYLLSPEAQLSKNDPANWGDFTVLAIDELDKKDRVKFEELELGLATLPIETLEIYGVPEIPSEYWEALEIGWVENILRK